MTIENGILLDTMDTSLETFLFAIVIMRQNNVFHFSLSFEVKISEH